MESENLKIRDSKVALSQQVFGCSKSTQQRRK